MTYLDQHLLKALERQLQTLPAQATIGVGLSAGADSAMLAVHAAAICQKLGLKLHGLHIHHGLQKPANEWQNRAHRLAYMLGMPCHSRRLSFTVNKTGMEAAARNARYTALNEMAESLGISHILLAHHLNDQAETVLFRLLRGAGPLGLAAMSATSVKGQITYLRPWLNQSRDLIVQAANDFAHATGWQAVKDPSNVDIRYSRGIIRTQLAPILDQHWPAWRNNFARHADQVSELQLWLAETQHELWVQLDPAADNLSFSLKLWRNLKPWQQIPILRYWLQLNNLPMPSQARINAWLKQLRHVHQSGTDRNVCLKHGDKIISLKQGRVCLQDFVE